MMKAVAIGGWAGPGIHQPGRPMTGRKTLAYDCWVAGRGHPRPAPEELSVQVSQHSAQAFQRHLSIPGHTTSFSACCRLWQLRWCI